MKLSEVRKLLDEREIQYILTAESSDGESYRKKGIPGVLYLLTIRNPHHGKGIEIKFADASEDPELFDLDFGGYGYDLWGQMEDELSRDLMDEIRNITSDRVWVILATDAKTNAVIRVDAYYDTEDWNSMNRFQKRLRAIKKPKSLWHKLIGRTLCYEVFSWSNYEKIIK